MRIRFRVSYPLGWALAAVAIAVLDVAGWLVWRDHWPHDLVLTILGLIGFKLFYELGYATKKLTMTTLRPGRRYRIAGPDGVWVVVGLTTSMDERGGRAEVTLIDEADYERLVAPKAKP